MHRSKWPNSDKEKWTGPAGSLSRAVAWSVQDAPREDNSRGEAAGDKVSQVDRPDPKAGHKLTLMGREDTETTDCHGEAS